MKFKKFRKILDNTSIIRIYMLDDNNNQKLLGKFDSSNIKLTNAFDDFKVITVGALQGIIDGIYVYIKAPSKKKKKCELPILVAQENTCKYRGL